MYWMVHGKRLWAVEERYLGRDYPVFAGLVHYLLQSRVVPRLGKMDPRAPGRTDPPGVGVVSGFDRFPFVPQFAVLASSRKKPGGWQDDSGMC